MFFQIVAEVYILKILAGATIKRISCDHNELAVPDEQAWYLLIHILI